MMPRYRIVAERTQSAVFEIDAADQDEAQREAEREAEALPDHEWHTQSTEVEVSEA